MPPAVDIIIIPAKAIDAFALCAKRLNIREYNPMKRIWELKTRILNQPFVRYVCVIRQNAQKDGRHVV